MIHGPERQQSHAYPNQSRDHPAQPQSVQGQKLLGPLGEHEGNPGGVQGVDEGGEKRHHHATYVHHSPVCDMLFKEGQHDQHHAHGVNHHQNGQREADELGQANIADDKAEETHRRRNLFIGHGGGKLGEIVGKRCGQADGGGETRHQHRKTQNKPAHGTEERGGQGVEQGAAVGERGGGDGSGIGEHKIHHGQKQGSSNAAEHGVFYNALLILDAVPPQGVDDNDGKGQPCRAVQGQIALHHTFEKRDGAVVLLGSAHGAVGDGGGVHRLSEQAAQEDHQDAEK